MMGAAAWWLLAGAIVTEMAATSALKLSEGFTKPIPSVAVVLGYGAAFYLLSLALKTVPVSVAYALWSALGTVGIVAIGVTVFREPFGVARAAGVALIIAGVVLLNLKGGGH